MLRTVRVLGLILLTGVAGTTIASAQAGKFLYVGGGLTVPAGDYKDDGAKTGFVADVGLGTNVGSGGRLFAFADIFYGKNNYPDDEGSTTLMGGGANIGIQSSGSSSRVYGYGGLGLQQHKYNPPGGGDGGSSTKPYARGAVGISLGSGNTTFWAEVGYLMGFKDEGYSTAYLPIMAGISIGW